MVSKIQDKFAWYCVHGMLKLLKRRWKKMIKVLNTVFWVLRYTLCPNLVAATNTHVAHMRRCAVLPLTCNVTSVYKEIKNKNIG